MIKRYYQNHPINVILIVAITVRLIAAFFSEGYAFHDDHFDVTRVANSWAQGIPHWLESGVPPKHSMLYAGINAVILKVVDIFGGSNPYTKTTVLRIVHALYSVLIVWLGFKITLKLANRKTAILVGWILALLWFMPFMSVRFLVEMVCIPPVMAGFYLLIKNNSSTKDQPLLSLMAGLLFGVAFAFRYHTILFAGGLGLVLLFRKEWLSSLRFTFGYLIAAFMTVGMIDLLFFDYPFHSIVEYFMHNSGNSGNYISGSPFKFTLTTFGFLFPPISIFLMLGYIKSYRVEPMMFLAVLVFFIFHSAFPNQQERFIFPMFPLLVVLGLVDWEHIVSKVSWIAKYNKAFSASWIFWWGMNIAVGLFLIFTFTKRDRVEPLHYLWDKEDLQGVLIENEKSVKQPPVFYLGDNVTDYNEWDKGILGLDSIDFTHPDHRVVFRLDPKKPDEILKTEFLRAKKQPNYIIFQGSKEIESRKLRVASILNANLVYLTSVKPAFLDRMLHYFNPKHHRDQTATIYKVD